MSKTILITGGTGKVGKQLVNHFAALDFQVVFTSRSDENIKKLTAGRKNVIGLKVDFLEDNCVDKLVEELNSKNIQVNYLVNNARNLDCLKVEDDGTITRKNWLNEYSIDVVIPYGLSVKLSKTNYLEKIINISSVYGMIANNPHLYEEDFKPLLNYSCAKASLIHLTKCLAVLFADKNIQVNCVTYGGVEGRVDDDFKMRYAKLCPQKRMMKENEVIGSVDFLISEKSHYITGQNIVVDGGLTIW